MAASNSNTPKVLSPEDELDMSEKGSHRGDLQGRHAPDRSEGDAFGAGFHLDMSEENREGDEESGNEHSSGLQGDEEAGELTHKATEHTSMPGEGETFVEEQEENAKDRQAS